MILYYKSSNGTTWDLKVEPIRTRTFNAHDYEWRPQATTQRYGERVYRFDKDAQKYKARLTVMGSMAERRRRLNLLHDAFEADIINMTPGQIYHGIYHIDCFITMSSTFAEDYNTENDIEIYCPYPFWVHEEKYSFDTVDGPQYKFLDYPMDFAYDYAAQLNGSGATENAGTAAANYQLTMYGSASSPFVIINGRKIGVTGMIGTSERVVIRSKEKTVQKISDSGVVTNMFNERTKGEVSIFDPLGKGTNQIMWNGMFRFDLIIYEERSEPLWI